jgi:hypothetical protein
MKIRIKGNSLRYRLTRSEVKRFTDEGYLEETTTFGFSQLKYALQVIACGNLFADFENNSITLFMPEFLLREWATTDIVGFNNTADGLHLLIEKDFMCLDLIAEDQSDNYPNPLKVSTQPD